MCFVGSSPMRMGEKENPWMWAGQGGSAAGRFRNAQTAHVKAAKAAAINKPGNDFMGWDQRGAGASYSITRRHNGLPRTWLLAAERGLSAGGDTLPANSARAARGPCYARTF